MIFLKTSKRIRPAHSGKGRKEATKIKMRKITIANFLYAFLISASEAVGGTTRTLYSRFFSAFCCGGILNVSSGEENRERGD